eukprot:gene1328-1250_t
MASAAAAWPRAVLVQFSGSVQPVLVQHGRLQVLLDAVRATFGVDGPVPLVVCRTDGSDVLDNEDVEDALCVRHDRVLR